MNKEFVVKELCEMGKLGMLPKDYHKIFRRLEFSDLGRDFSGMSASQIADELVMTTK